MRLVSDVLRSKGHTVWSIDPNSTVYEALQLMAEKDVGALFVVEEGHLVGVFAERDYARKVILKGRSSLNTSVREIMSEQVIPIHPDQHLEDCMALMTQYHIRYLPVLNGLELMGVISIGDVVKEIIAEQTMEIEQLENYIYGQR